MATPREANETRYYDLQELTFIPGLSDKEAAWVDKVLTLGHPEDWAEGIGYTAYVGVRARNLLMLYVGLPTSELNTEFTTYQQTHEVPRTLSEIHEDLERAGERRYSMTGARVSQVIHDSMVREIPEYREVNISELAENGHYNWWDERPIARNGRWNWYGQGEGE